MSRISADSISSRSASKITISNDVGVTGFVTSIGVSVSGVITATTFQGNGSQLTGVISGIQIREEGTTVGTAITNLNFVGGDITVTASGAGSTVTLSSSSDITSSLFS